MTFLLPWLRGRFVGREDLLATLRNALVSGRLVTLLGPPGVGKTRIAAEVLAASDLAQRTFVDLTEAHDIAEAGARVAGSVAAQMGEGDPWEQAARALSQGGEGLLVLDNVEQLATTLAPRIEGMLDAAPGLTILVTSRIPLGLADEQRVVVPTLDRRGGGSVDEAASLFVARLGEAGLPVPTSAVIERLMELLDGLPLAIELAAARARVVSPAEMLSRLDHESPASASVRFRLLGRLDRSPRRWSLEESIHSSFVLLGAEARGALEQASVFRGGFSLDAAEAVIAPGSEDLFDVLEQLESASLLTVDTGGATTRYRLLLSIREHAEARRRQREDERLIVERHASWVLDSAIRASEQPFEMRRWLDQERENVLAALHGYVERKRPSEALTLATLAADDSGQPYRAREARLDEAIALARSSAPSRDVARALLARGDIRRFLGRGADSLADLEEALPHAIRAGDPALVARAHAGRGNALTMSASWSSAREAFEQALACHGASGDIRAQGRVLAMVAATHFNEDEWDRCRTLLDEALGLLAPAALRTRGTEISPQDADEDGEAMVRISLGITALARGSLADAAAPLTEGLYLARRVGNRHWEAMALGALARLKLESGDASGGREALDEALREARRLGVRRAEAMALLQLGGALLETRDPSSEGLLLESARLARSVCPDHESMALILLSFAALSRGDRALAAARRTEAKTRAAKYPRPSVDAALAVAEGGAPSAAFSGAIDVALVTRLARAHGRDEAPGMVVGPSSAWFQIGVEPAVSLRRRVALARILDALVELRERPAAAPLSARDLIALGWPGERVLEQAGLDRVYAAIATLRRLGLRSVLLEREGYLLDPATRIERSARQIPGTIAESRPGSSS